MKNPAPFVHITHNEKTPVESGGFDQFGPVYEERDGYHALFAAKVHPEPYEVMEQRKWGWVERELLEDVLDRQGQFIASQHAVDPRHPRSSPDLRTLALRYISYPGTGQVEVILAGKLFHWERDVVEAMARAWYRDVAALFSSDYGLSPFTTQETFQDESGQAVLEDISASAQTAEVRRFETFLTRPLTQEVLETHYLVTPFIWHLHGMDKVWQVMARLASPAIVSVTLRPTYLYEDEDLSLARLYEAATALADSGEGADRVMGEQAAEIYRDYVRTWRQPYLVRAQIVALEGVPDGLARALGCALSYGRLTGGGSGPPFAGYELAQPVGEEWKIARHNVALLEMDPWGEEQAAPPFARFRYLAAVGGALCAFRLPFVPKAGMPGVRFEQKAGPGIESPAD